QERIANHREDIGMVSLPGQQQTPGKPNGPGSIKSSTPPGQPVTAAILAEILGLSRSTVSIVLRGDAQRRKISPQTVQRVLDAAKQYDSVPNLTAQNLRRQRSGVVSVLIVNCRMDWCEELMGGVMSILDGARYTPFVAAHRNSAARQEKELMSAIQRRDDAVI